MRDPNAKPTDPNAKPTDPNALRDTNAKPTGMRDPNTKKGRSPVWVRMWIASDEGS
ncbi:hypothetical protein T484DRAFT_1787901 [Baffinella frigidus]|nr:hypothetical protein T484DRAFT_1787901 [Cryptophyta sp. CCMP2293]